MVQPYTDGLIPSPLFSLFSSRRSWQDVPPLRPPALRFKAAATLSRSRFVSVDAARLAARKPCSPRLLMYVSHSSSWQVAAVYARVLAYVTNVATNAASAIPPPAFQSLWDAIAAHVGAAPIGSEADYPLVSVASSEATCPLSQPDSVAPFRELGLY